MFITQTQKRYWTQELSNPRPDLQNRVQRRRDTGRRNYQIRVQTCKTASKRRRDTDAGIIKSASRPAKPRPDAEEILDAEIIKSASRPAKPRPDAEEILDAGIIKPASRPAGSASPPPEGHGMSLMSLLECEKKGVIHLNPSITTTARS